MYKKLNHCFLKTICPFSSRTNPFFLKKRCKENIFSVKNKALFLFACPILVFSTLNHLFGYIILKIFIFYALSIFTKTNVFRSGFFLVFLFFHRNNH